MAYTDHFKLPAFKIILIFVCLTLMGCFLLPKLAVRLTPEKESPQLSISFSMPNMQSKVVEMEVTSKLESMLSRVKGVEKVSSTSGNGWGQVHIQLDKSEKLDVARFEIATLIRQLYPSLPPDVSYPVLTGQEQTSNQDNAFMTYTLNAPSSPIHIQQYAEKIIKNKLANLEGVDAVYIYGATQMIWKLVYDYDQLQQAGLKVQDIQAAIQAYLNTENMGLGLTESGLGAKQWIRIASTSGIQGSTFDASQVCVRNQSGKLLRLNELVQVSYVEEEATSHYRINGLNSVYLTILPKNQANQLKLAKAVKKELAVMSKQFPPNYEMHLVYDATEYIQQELDTILFRSGLTLLILFLFVLLIYRNLKSLLLISVSLLSNLAIAVCLYYFLKLEMHLYSLMGITISLSLMLDNIIVMSDQIHRQKNRKAFLAILAATLTTISALVMIFFLDEKIRLNLADFAIVILINLGVSLSVVLLLVPALMVKLQLHNRQKKTSVNNRRITVKFNRLYRTFIMFTSKKRGWVLALALLVFGLPVFMLPKKIEKQNKPAEIYNKTLGSDLYQDKIKPISDLVLGGSLRLFVDKVVDGSYWKSNEETMIHVYLSMRNGSTLEQTDYLISSMEEYLRKQKGIKQFQSNVQKLQANISIRFTKQATREGFHYQLYNKLVGKGLELGGGSWSIYCAGDAFNNEMRENAGSYRIKMMGYNYDELYARAEQVRDTLMSNRRIKDVLINSEFNWYKSDYQEFTFKLDKQHLIEANKSPQALFNNLSPLYATNWYAGLWPGAGGYEPIRLFSQQADQYDSWQMQHMPGLIDQSPYRLNQLASIEKFQAPQLIARDNQQYLLCLQYEYLGSDKQGGKVLDRMVEKIQKELPIGYSIQSDKDVWDYKKNRKQYVLLLIVLFIIYFITSILFNSLKQPLAILLIIPISFIGLFVTFWAFKLHFDQGGFAAFVLLCGITVNAGIYLVNQYNNLQKIQPLPALRAYLRAWNLRIIPIFLTILSTSLGFVPFLIGEKQSFWFPLAAGTIGGLVMSMVGLFVFLPIYLGVGKCKEKT